LRVKEAVSGWKKIVQERSHEAQEILLRLRLKLRGCRLRHLQAIGDERSDAFEALLRRKRRCRRLAQSVLKEFLRCSLRRSYIHEASPSQRFATRLCRATNSICLLLVRAITFFL
jgi:hypothetical protein